MPIQPKGLLATEAFVTIPFADRWPVAVRSHYVEFLDDTGRVRSIDSLRRDHEYAVLVTTGGGLWRYPLGDRVRVDGFVGRTPSLRFVGRADHVVDLRGEKLSEGFVGSVLRALLGDGVAFSMLAPEVGGDVTRYTLFASIWHCPDLAALAAELDIRLSNNPHYAWCRRLGQLAPATVVVVAPDAAKRFLIAEAAAGKRMGDVRPTPLSARTDWRSILCTSQCP